MVTRGIGSLGLESAQLQKAVGHHHRGQYPALSAGILPARPGHHHRADDAQSAQRAEPGHQVAELSQQHPRQDRGEQRRRGGGRHVERGRFRGRMHGRQPFIVKNRALFTPPLSAGALYGITRADGDRTGGGSRAESVRAEPDALRFVQRGRMFPDRHGRGS